MTELYIGGSPVVLPEDFGFPIIEENPFFTKNGKYTYEIELSLSDPRNAKVYQHVNRINNSFPLFENRSAILIVDNKIELNGIEIITDISEKHVKVQLASGNSELNFVIGGEQMIRDLDLGTVTVVTENQMGANIIYAPHINTYSLQGYPIKNFVLAPFYGEDKSHYGNKYMYYSLNPEAAPINPQFTSTSYRPMPFFVHIVNQIIFSLGYSFGYNALLAHTIIRDYILIHGYNTLIYSQMLPGWTVNDFFSKIEKQFDCSFIVDESNKVINIYFNAGSWEAETLQNIDVFDSYNCNVDRDNTNSLQIGNFGYKFDNQSNYRYAKLAKEIVDYSIEDTYADLTELRNKILDTEDDDRFRKIYKGSYGDMIAYSNGGVFATKVDYFKNLYQNEKEELDEEFDIVPAPMKTLLASVVWMTDVYSFYDQVPVVLETELDPSEIPGDLKLFELVNGTTEIPKIQPGDKMYLAIYKGPYVPHFLPGNVPSFSVNKYPICFVEALSQYFNGETHTIRWFMSQGVNPFRFEWLKANIYSTDTIDSTRKYIMRFSAKNKIDITKGFITKNKRLVCVKYEKVISKDGVDPVYEGEFYAVK